MVGLVGTGPCHDEHGKLSRKVARLAVELQSNKVVSDLRVAEAGSSLLYSGGKFQTAKGSADHGACEAMAEAKRTQPADPQDIVFAYFIRGHENPSQSMRLLKRIYSEKHVYLMHFDLGAHRKDREEIKQRIEQEYGLKNNVHILPPRSVTYMGFSLLFLDVAAIRTFLNMKGAKWDYFINLSSQEYPMLSQTTMQKVLSRLYGHNFIDIWCPYALAPTYKQNRVDLLHADGNHLAKFNGKNVNRDKEKPVGSELGLGSFYVVLSRSFCESFFEDPVMLDLLSYMPGVRIPDELFFTSAILSSKRYRCTLFNTNFRFTGWGRSSLYDHVKCSLSEKIEAVKGKSYLTGGSHPCILGPSELAHANQMSGPLNFFANKFDEAIDSSGMDMLDQKIDHYKYSMEEIGRKLPWLERPFPHPLHCPNYHGAGV
eukprot:g4025.t1